MVVLQEERRSWAIEVNPLILGGSGLGFNHEENMTTIGEARAAQIDLAHYKRQHGLSDSEKTLRTLRRDSLALSTTTQKLEFERKKIREEMSKLSHALNRPIVEQAVYEISGTAGGIVKREFNENHEWCIPLRFTEIMALNVGKVQLFEALKNILRSEVDHFYAEAGKP